MAKTYNRLELDVNKKPNSIGIRPVQNDTKSRYLDVCLYENGVPINLTGEQVRITFRKADGSTFFNQGEVTDATAGRCQFALTNEILSEAKAVEAQISVWNAGGQILSTQVFEIYVTAAIPWTDAVESENEYGVLVVLFQEIQDALDTMHKIATTFGEPGDKAAEYGVDTFWGILETLAGRADVETILKKYIKDVLNSTFEGSYFRSIDKMISSKAGTSDFKPMDQYIHDFFASTTKTAACSELDIGSAVVVRSTTMTISESGVWQNVSSFTATKNGAYIIDVICTNDKYTQYRIIVDGSVEYTASHNSRTGITNKVVVMANAGQNIEIQGYKTKASYTVEFSSVKYFIVENAVNAKTIFSGNSDNYLSCETFTPEANGIMMVVFGCEATSVKINGILTSTTNATNASGRLSYAYITVQEGVPVTIDAKYSCYTYVRSCVFNVSETMKTVKTVQRGTYTISSLAAGVSSIKIPIGHINSGKAYAIIEGYIREIISIEGISITDDAILLGIRNISSGAGSNVSIPWQLIEFW